MAPDITAEQLSKTQAAVCHANRAAAYLIPRKGVNATKALEDGEAAETTNSSYVKA